MLHLFDPPHVTLRRTFLLYLQLDFMLHFLFLTSIVPFISRYTTFHIFFFDTALSLFNLHFSLLHATLYHHSTGDLETSKKMQDEMINAAEEFYQSLGTSIQIFVPNAAAMITLIS